MPLNPTFSADVFSVAPTGSVPVALLSAPEPDTSYTQVLETASAIDESSLDPKVQYIERFRWVEEFLGNRSQSNVVVNPMLQYHNPNALQLNQMPPDWTLDASGQPSDNRWKFVPFVVDAGSDQRRKFPLEEILENFTQSVFTVFFPNGYFFHYKANEPHPTLDCTISGKTVAVEKNEPYVLEVYYTYDPLPPFTVSGFSYPASSDYFDDAEMSVTVYGMSPANTVTETVLSAKTVQRRQNLNQIGSCNQIVRTPVDYAPTYVARTASLPRSMQMDRVRRWVCSSDIVFTAPGTLYAKLTFRFKKVPGLAVLAVVMYKRSAINAFRWDTSRIFAGDKANLSTSYAFAPTSSWNESYPSLINPDAPTRAAFHNLRLPSTVYAGADTRGLGQNAYVLEFIQPLQSPAGGHLSGPFVRLYVGRTFGYPPTNKTRLSRDSRHLDACYLILDRYALPDTGVLSYPYNGSYVTVSREIVNGTVVSTWRLAADRPYANVLEILTDDIPVLRNWRYLLYSPTDLAFDNFNPPLVDPHPDVAPVFKRDNGVSPELCFRYVAVGYDKDGNVTELAYFSPYMTSSARRPNTYVIFTNPATTKARIGVVFMQPYVHPADVDHGSDQTRPVLCLMYQREYINLYPFLLLDYWADGGEPSASDANFLPEEMADFRTSGWTLHNCYLLPGNEAPGQVGYVRGRDCRVYSGRLAWVQTSDQFLFLCCRIRYRVSTATRGAPCRVVVHFLRGDQSYVYISYFWYMEVPDTNWRDELIVLPFTASLNRQPYPDSVSVSFSWLSSTVEIQIGYFNVGFVNDLSTSNRRLRRVSDGVKPVVVLPDLRKPPRVVGVCEVNRFHWALKVRPGIAYIPYRVPPGEVAHSFVKQAGFSAGDELVLVYHLPEYSHCRPGGGAPSLYKRENVIVENGVFKVSEPVDTDRAVWLTLDDGTVLTGTFAVERFGREVSIKGQYANYSGTAEVLYAHYAHYYLYTGCYYEDGSELLPAVFNLSPYGTETGIVSGPFIAQLLRAEPFNISVARPFRYRIGAYLYLLPYRAIRKEDFDAGDREGVRLPNPNYMGSYLRHALGYFSILNNTRYLSHRVYDSQGNIVSSYAMAALPLAWCCYLPPLGIGYIDLLDLRSRGGGLVEGYRPQDAGAYWDMSDWDGASAITGGRAVVRLPSALLRPAPDRDAFSHEQILEIIRRYLPAGIDYEVEYVD